MEGYHYIHIKKLFFDVKSRADRFVVPGFPGHQVERESLGDARNEAKVTGAHHGTPIFRSCESRGRRFVVDRRCLM